MLAFHTIMWPLVNIPGLLKFSLPLLGFFLTFCNIPCIHTPNEASLSIF